MKGRWLAGVTAGVSSDGGGADLLNHSSMVGAFSGKCVPRVWYMLYVHWVWGGGWGVCDWCAPVQAISSGKRLGRWWGRHWK